MRIASKAALFVLPCLPLLAVAFASPGVARRPAGLPKEVTYSEHVASILYSHCTKCHHPGESAPFSLVGYDNAKKWSGMMAKVTSQGLMPPWKTAPVDVAFHDENHLSQVEIEALKEWSNAGAPRGDAAREPKPPTYPEGWALGKPDLVISAPEPFHLDSEGQDEYWNFVIDPHLTKPVWVNAVDVKPNNRRIVHHVIIYLDKGDKSAQMLAQPGSRDGAYLSFGGPGFNPDGSLGGWAPGVAPRRLPADVAFRVDPGTKLVMQVHYNKSGKAEEDHTQVGLYYSTKPSKKEAHIAWLANPWIDIKPNDSRATFTKVVPIRRDMTLYWLMPHMHMLGHTMKVALTYPDGKQKKLIDVKDWDFNWQIVYSLEKPLDLPKGSKLTIVASFDNSTGNLRNPNNPPKEVRWGEKTKDEMMLLVAMITAKQGNLPGDIEE